jgi:hypothetical protein
MADRPLYHRLAPSSERSGVQAAGTLWGKAKSNFWGDGPAMVKAYQGRLPAGQTGYTFTSGTAPTRFGRHMGMPSVEWHEGSPGVLPAPLPDHVMIEVQVLDDDDLD